MSQFEFDGTTCMLSFKSLMAQIEVILFFLFVTITQHLNTCCTATVHSHHATQLQKEIKFET